MYRLQDFFQSVFGIGRDQLPSDEFCCGETNSELAFYTNKMQDSLAAHTYTLVESGWLNLIYGERQLRLERGDLYIYYPGFQITIVSCSDDFRGICLMADESVTFETPITRSIIRTAYLPVVEWGQPVMKLHGESFELLRSRLYEMLRCLTSNHRFRAEALRTHYALFLLDLADIQERAAGRLQYSERTAELFVSFMRLLPKHFADHHDIAFYASALCVSTTHLSRIVRQITGRTVMDYINQLLLMEASWLLAATDQSIAAIAEQLHFADQSSFSKFFTRQKGCTPKRFRIAH